MTHAFQPPQRSAERSFVGSDLRHGPDSEQALTGPPGETPLASVGTVGVFIALGSNLGDRERHLRQALESLEADGTSRVLRCSSLHETAPVGGPPGQGRYLNAAAELWTLHSPHALLESLLAIERLHGRRRDERHAPRTLDLDLLLYGERVICDARLELPHPRMWEREFVMAPLREISDPARLARLRQRLGIAMAAAPE